MSSLFQELLNFYKKPTLNHDPKLEAKTIFQKIFLIVRLWSFLFICLILSGFLIDFILYKTGYSGSNLNEEVAKMPFLYGLLLAGIAGPIWEEILTRLFLSKKPTFLALGSIFFVLFLLQYITPIFSILNPNFLLIFKTLPMLFSLGLGLLFIPIFWFLNSYLKRLEKVGKLEKIEKFAPAMVFSSILAFSFAHIINWTSFDQNLFILPWLILPQLILSFGLVFIRIRFGFFYGIFLHILNNSFIFLMAFLAGQMENHKFLMPVVAFFILSVLFLAIQELVFFIKNRQKNLVKK